VAGRGSGPGSKPENAVNTVRALLTVIERYDLNGRKRRTITLVV